VYGRGNGVSMLRFGHIFMPVFLSSLDEVSSVIDVRCWIILCLLTFAAVLRLKRMILVLFTLILDVIRRFHTSSGILF
jgi:hypothetical protein